MGQPVKIKREKEKSVALKRLTQAQSNNRRVRREGHCYMRLLYLCIIHVILQAESGPGIICDYTSEQSSHTTM